MTEAVKLPTYVRLTLIIAGIIGTLYLLYIGAEVIVPLIFALFLSILLNPMVNWLTRHRVPKLLAISLAVLSALIVMFGLVGIISAQFSMVAKTFPQLQPKLHQAVDESVTKIASLLRTDPSIILTWLHNTRVEAMKSLNASLGQTLMTVASAFVIIFLVPVYIFLILLYKPLLLEFIRRLFDQKHHKTVVEVLGSIKTIIQSYLVGLLIESVIVAVLNSVALLALGVEYAIILGITGAILNVIPYIGGVIGFGVPMIIAFLTKSPLTALLVFLIYSVIQFVDNHYIVPYVVASKVQVNALVAIVVVITGGILWGVPGMFLSIPLTALIKVIFDHIEPLKPWGFVIGDEIPDLIKLPFSTPRNKKK